MTAALVSGLKEMSRPLTFLRYKEVWWVWALYAGTYVAANGISTVAESLGVGAGAPKLVGTTAVNLPASIIKDQALARMFSATAATTAAAAAVSRMPLASYALFTLRDIVSIAASFTLPEAVASHLTEARDWSTAAAEGTSQLLVPSAMQLITTPLHLVGLDIFNRPAASTAMRMQMLGRLYGSSLALRFGRTGIAFGLGGVVNKKVRDALRKPPQRISLPLPAAA
ncbi:hypothetical protein JKP88DRAFT_198943 [Tribonema minus]|uniref:Uncharacterized protein n=1 Tax=Tribonema minus TaxID=303371 RepID=A0A835YZC8_9STRA|nr:hypothetical protein JKP88DRAFT_198943 [Tribonema minus]